MTDIEIAQKNVMDPITDVAAKIDIPVDKLELYGPYKAKITFDELQTLQAKASKNPGKLILVTAVTPTPAGEGKSTVSIGLADGLNKIGKKTVVALREPSLGPCFGMKGGACGGGYSQVIPMEKINLHFTGDFHAITTANNLIAAAVDNYFYHNPEEFRKIKKITFKRCVDINDRSLRTIYTKDRHGNLIETGFDITPASEIMAIFCLATDIYV